VSRAGLDGALIVEELVLPGGATSSLIYASSSFPEVLRLS
jgi:hypothetical protein